MSDREGFRDLTITLYVMSSIAYGHVYDLRLSNLTFCVVFCGSPEHEKPVAVGFIQRWLDGCGPTRARPIYWRADIIGRC